MNGKCGHSYRLLGHKSQLRPQPLDIQLLSQSQGCSKQEIPRPPRLQLVPPLIQQQR
jgi:hypothetical protein